MKKEYPTNLTDNQWQILQKILEPSTRKRKYSLRDIMNCILYVNKTGCQWRMTPKEFPPHNIVFYYFTKWKREGVFEDIMDTLREKLRKILADGGYMGEELKELVRKTLGCNLEVVLRPNESHKSSISSLEMNCRKVFRLAVQLQEGCLGLRVLLRILQGHDSNRLLKNHV